MSETVSIVTGAGQELGRAVALTLARAGHRLVVVDQDDDKVRALVRELLGMGAEATFCHVSRYDSLQVHNIIAGALDNFGQIDALAHCETDFFERPFADMRVEDFDEFAVMTQRAAFLLNHAVTRQIIGQSTEINDGGVGIAASGSVVNVTSLDAIKAHEDRALMAMVSGGIVQLTKAMAMTLAPFGARANAVALSWVKNTYLAQQYEWNPKAVYAPPLGRRGGVDEAAAAIAFLMSPEASYITGQVMPVDGGVLAHYKGPSAESLSE